MSSHPPPNVRAIKHMAFAVRDVRSALATYVRLLGVPADIAIVAFPKSRNWVATFRLGDVEYQLCQSMDAGGRFASWIRERGGEGLHHICYEVASIDQALEQATAAGARLRLCQACGVTGAHPHPEGYVALLDDDAAGIEIEFMQVYADQELARYREVQGV